MAKTDTDILREYFLRINSRTVRIFISSTFRDMEAERDYLIKIVFPELRERCRAKNLSFIDIDLRWGITEAEAERKKIIEICLNQIDQARPFFICLLGERYGGIIDSYPTETLRHFPWLKDYKDHSYTAIEIIYSILFNPMLKNRCFFYFRDKKIIDEIPLKYRDDYISENPNSEEKLVLLKKLIKEKAPSVMENYPCYWDEKKEKISGLSDLGKKVLKDFWTAIKNEFLLTEDEIDPIQQQRIYHNFFLKEKSELFVGDPDVIYELMYYIEHTSKVLLTGNTGSGKSSVLARFIKLYSEMSPKTIIFPYFVDVSIDSSDYFELLLQIGKEISKNFSIQWHEPENKDRIPHSIIELLNSPKLKKKDIIIIIDGWDRLIIDDHRNIDTYIHRNLPLFIKKNVRFIISCTNAGDPSSLYYHNWPNKIHQPNLPREDRKKLIETLLASWGRKMTRFQLELLLDNPILQNPFLLRIALEELRLFGRFEELNEKISGIPKTMPAFFNQILDRIEKDYTKALTKKVFGFIATAKYGLADYEILQLLENSLSGPFPRAKWINFYRSCSFLLRERGNLIIFHNQNLLELIINRYVQDNKIEFHRLLASFFSNTLDSRKIIEYPYQLFHSIQWKKKFKLSKEEWDAIEKLAEILTDLDFYRLDKTKLSRGSSRFHKLRYLTESEIYWETLKEYFGPEEYFERKYQKIQTNQKDKIDFSFLAGYLLAGLGYYEASTKYYLNALEHFENPHILNNLANNYSHQGKYNEAEGYFRKALELYKKESDYGGIVLTLIHLGLIYSDIGKSREAEKLYKKAVKMHNAKARGIQPITATMYFNYGIVLNRLKKIKKALKNLKKAMDISTMTLGPEHHKTLYYKKTFEKFESHYGS